MHPGKKPVSLFLVEDHAALREGLKLLLEIEGDIAVIAEAESGSEAVRVAAEVKPDVVLMDVALAGMDGIEATRKLHAEQPLLQILVLSANPELGVVRAAIEAGAAGYILKRATGRELRDAVRAAASGQIMVLSPEVAAVGPRERPRGTIVNRSLEDPRSILTAREMEILQFIARGSSNREIAEVLQISIKTVDTHRMHLMTKLDIHDVAGLTRYAIRKGLIE
jgi:DNA-binding NarL/FixJ family response regulator